MRKRWFSMIVFGLCFLSIASSVPHTTYSATTQSLPYVPGFPRDEPTGPIWADSPTVADIDGNGSIDILTGDNTGCVWGWNNRGELLPSFPWKTQATCSNSGRIRNSLAVANLDGKPGLEIGATTNGTGTSPGSRGKIAIWHHDGQPLSGWPKEMDWSADSTANTIEAHSIVFSNLIGDSNLEVMSGTSNSGGGDNLYAWYANGDIMSGFPNSYKTGGIFGPIGAADMNKDGYAEIIAGRDHVHAHAYFANGQQMPGWPIDSYFDPNLTDWDTVKSVEFTNNAPSMGDLDGNGTIEIVIAGRTRDNALGIDPPHWIGNSVMVFEADGTRRKGWGIPPLSGPPLADTSWPTQAPALADLDGDGKLEIVVALSDGIMRAYRENGALYWSYNYAQGKILYGSEPAIGDITGDGILDVVFGTYSPDASANSSVGILALNGRTGQLLPSYPLPLNRETVNAAWGVMAAPTIANIDSDCNAELIAGSMSGVVYAWQLPAPYVQALMPWPTGRQNFQRTGTYNPAFARSMAEIEPLAVGMYRASLPLITNSQPVIPKGC